MSTAVAIADEICRTVLYLAAIGAFVKVAPLFLPRLQVMRAQNPPQPSGGHPEHLPAAEAGINGQARQEAHQ